MDDFRYKQVERYYEYKNNFELREEINVEACYCFVKIIPFTEYKKWAVVNGSTTLLMITVEQSSSSKLISTIF